MSKKLPLVSIVTPSFNQAQFIEKTILSVLLQDYTNLEYKVLDSLSQDGTAKIMKRYGQHAQMIRAKDDGQSDAINKGLNLCNGEIIAYLNSDDCYANNRVVSRVVEIFNDRPDIDVLVGKREYINEAGYYVLNYPFRDFHADKLLKACYIPQEATFWRRSIYEKAGNCVDKTLKFAMDYDLWLRFLAAGANFLCVDETFGLFRWYPGQKSIDIWKKYGVPEISQLQTKHLGRALPEDIMIAEYQEYWHGSNRLTNLDAYKHSLAPWQAYTSYKKLLLSNCQRDSWVYHSRLQIPKRNMQTNR